MKKACVVKFQDIDSDLECGDNAGGVIKVFPFYHKDVDVWPAIPVAAEGMTLEEYATLVGDLVFKTGKCATQFKLPNNKGGFEIVELGEQGGISHQMELTIYQHGITKTMLGMMGVTKNAKMGFLVIDSNKNAFLMGDEDTGAYRDKGEGAKTGTARTDVAGTSLKFVYPVNNPRMYDGDTVSILKPAPAPA